ncbi:MAG: Rpn family recombination-promoting nuclease/putative transposase, partial [Prevotellaceae bacterium]|nr:Rpn family recombination-promoting nuclease/putative transposase [Prevotellaceae bacterium]
YSINIVYFALGKGDDYVYHGHTAFRGLHTGDKLQLTPAQREEFGMMEAGDLFPEYYILEVTHFNDVAKDTLDEWIYYLKNDKIEEGFSAQGLVQARELLDYDRLPDEEKQAYDRAVDNRRSERSSIHTAKKEGIMECEASGLEKGRAEGRAEELKNIVLKAHHGGFSTAQIQIITDLSKEQIKSILTCQPFSGRDTLNA